MVIKLSYQNKVIPAPAMYKLRTTDEKIIFCWSLALASDIARFHECSVYMIQKFCERVYYISRKVLI